MDAEVGWCSHITDVGGEEISNAMRENSMINKFDLRLNMIDPQYMRAGAYYPPGSSTAY